MFIKQLPKDKRKELNLLLNKDIELNQKYIEHLENLAKYYKSRITFITDVKKNKIPIEHLTVYLQKNKPV